MRFVMRLKDHFRDDSIIKGVILVTGACALWGLIFIIPLFLKDCDVIDVALGRYFFFGIVSLIFLGSRGSFFFRYPKLLWFDAIKLAFFSTILHYSALILCMRYLGSTLATLILGLSAICVSLYGCYKERTSLLKILLPSILICSGLPLLYLAKIKSMHLNLLDSLLGFVFALIALGSWVIYLLANHFYSKKYPYIKAHDWISLIGLGALLFVLISLGPRFYFKSIHSLNIDLKFITCSLILGLGSSWLASLLWNCGSELIPLSLSGPLVILETVFGLFFVYLFQKEFPKPVEWIGILFILCGIFFGLRANTQNLKKIKKNSSQWHEGL